MILDPSRDAGPPDSGPANADTGQTLPPTDAGQPDAGPPLPPLMLGPACDVQLDRAAAPIVPGTLPAAGPYHPCLTVGGQVLSPLDLSRDGARLAALDLLGEAVVMDTATLASRGRFARARGPYTALALSPSGTVLAAGAERDGEVDLYSVDDGTLLRAVDLGAAYSLFHGALAFSADGARVAATIGPDVAVIEVATGEVQRYADGTRCCANEVAFVDGGRKLATARYAYDPVGSGSPAVTLLDLASGGLTTLVDKHDIYGGMDLAATADGATLLTFRGGELGAWDGSTGAPKTAVSANDIAMRTLFGIDASGSAMAIQVTTTADYDSGMVHLQVRRIADGELIDDLRLQSGRGPALWSVDSNRMVVAAPGISGDAKVGVFDTRTRRPLAQACSPAAGTAYAFAPGAPRLLARVSGGLRVYDVGSGEPVGPLLGAGELMDMIAISPDGGWVAWSSFIVPSVGAEVTVANAETGDERTVGAPQNTYLAPAPSSGGRFVAVQDTQGRGVTVFDGATGATLGGLQGSTAGGGLIRFSDDGTALLFGNGGNVQAVDWRTGTATPVAAPGPHSLPPGAQAATGGSCYVGYVPYTVFSADGSRAAVGTECSRPWELGVVPHMDLYDVASGSLLQSFPNPQTDPPLLSSNGAAIVMGYSALWCR